jgi:hypothetical protein
MKNRRRGDGHVPDLWGLVWGKPSVDPQALADAIDREAARGELDYRTRLLIRDGVDALEGYWGAERCRRWLAGCAARERIEAVRREAFDRVGYPSLRERLMETTTPETIEQFLRELSLSVHRPTRLAVGGSASLILTRRLARATEDVDVVDEVPEEIRQQHRLLDRLRQTYGLHLAHFQSHFLPAGWQSRLHSLPPFGKLQVSLVDVHDVFLGKLFSARDKDRDDLRLLLPSLDRQALEGKMIASCSAFLADQALRKHAEENWYVLTGEPLPAPPPTEEPTSRPD